MSYMVDNVSTSVVKISNNLHVNSANLMNSSVTSEVVIKRNISQISIAFHCFILHSLVVTLL